LDAVRVVLVALAGAPALLLAAALLLVSLVLGLPGRANAGSVPHDSWWESHHEHAERPALPLFEKPFDWPEGWHELRENWIPEGRWQERLARLRERLEEYREQHEGEEPWRGPLCGVGSEGDCERPRFHRWWGVGHEHGHRGHDHEHPHGPPWGNEVPEPGTGLMTLIGLGLLALVARSRAGRVR
jgi:hypothetical protein